MTNQEIKDNLMALATGKTVNCDKLSLFDEAACAINELENKLSAQENLNPLTLDELREMDGEPVWIVEYPEWGHWELSAEAEDYLEDRDPDFYDMKHNDPAGRYGLHVLGWLAYRTKPEGSGE